MHFPVKIMAVGAFKTGPEHDLFQQYYRRLRHLKLIEIQSSSKKEEGDAFLKNLSDVPRDSLYILGLDERGKDYTSRDFSALLSSKSAHIKNFIFLIGGADGLDERVKAYCHELMCFGRMTWPHGLVRGMLCEQIYRATLIANNHPYHRD